MVFPRLNFSQFCLLWTLLNTANLDVVEDALLPKILNFIFYATRTNKFLYLN